MAGFARKLPCPCQVFAGATLTKKHTPKPAVWQPLSVYDNFTAAADALGFDNADIAWGLSKVQWESVQDREDFLRSLTAPRSRDIFNG